MFIRLSVLVFGSCEYTDWVQCNPGGDASFKGHSASLLLTCLAHLRALWPHNSVDEHTLSLSLTHTHPEGLSRSFSLSLTPSIRHTSEQEGWHPYSPTLNPSKLLAGKRNSVTFPEEEEQFISSQQLWHFLVDQMGFFLT